MTKPFVSVCIPTYGRPRQLKRLLESIDIEIYKGEVEIVISENCSPLQENTREVAYNYLQTKKYNVIYSENKKNLGFAGNLRTLVEKANGKWVILQGDDDLFVDGELDKFISFLHKNPNVGYVLRSYRVRNEDGSYIDSRYYKENIIFNKGCDSYIRFFRNSVAFSGMSFRKDWLEEVCNLDDFSYNPYYHLFFEAEMCFNYDSAAYSQPLVEYKEFKENKTEKEIHESMSPLVNVSVEDFMKVIKDIFIISNYIDKKYKINSTGEILKNYSKYSYPVLTAYERNSEEYKKLVFELKKLGFSGLYFNIYRICIRIFNVKICNKVIIIIKRILRKTPIL